MPISLPNLDDRRFAELVDEARALLPLYAPGWTDHNVSDPGITLIELFSALTEQNLYRLNRVTSAHKLKFLELIDTLPRGPEPARNVMRFALAPPASSLPLPAGVEFAAGEQGFPFRTRYPLSVSSSELSVIQVFDGRNYRRIATGSPDVFSPFASAAQGSALYLGFDRPLPCAERVGLYLALADLRPSSELYGDLFREARSALRAARSRQRDKFVHATRRQRLREHHSARVVWECFQAGSWTKLEVRDATRALTTSGHVLLTLPAQPLDAVRIGKEPQPLYYLRCRLVSGTFDALPKVQQVLWNAVELEQAQAASRSWPIRPGVAESGVFPGPGRLLNVRFALDTDRRISELEFGGEDGIPTRCLAYQPATASQEGTLALDLTILGEGTGEPYQRLLLGRLPVLPSLRLYELKDGKVWAFEQRPDLLSSAPSDRHYTLDAQRAELRFGDGRKARIPAARSVLVATYDLTFAEQCVISAGTNAQLADNLHNRGLIDVPSVSAALAAQLASKGIPGAAAETLDQALARAAHGRERAVRAVTLSDYEELARATPGVVLARVRALPNQHPHAHFPGAIGVITVMIVPETPAGRPYPSPALARAVTRQLERRRMIGTRVSVVGPSYLEVAIKTRIRLLPGARAQQVSDAVKRALDRFLDPLVGGPDGDGWPFGRAVYRAEVLQIIDGVADVDHVVTLELVAQGCEPQCGNLMLQPTWLVSPAVHSIEVE